MSMMGCGREGKGQTQALNHSCFHPPPQQELFSATSQGPYFLTHPYTFCWISSFLLLPHTSLERLGNQQLQLLMLFSFPILFLFFFFFLKTMQATLLGLGVKAFFIRTPNTLQDLCGALVTIAERNQGARSQPLSRAASSLCPQLPAGTERSFSLAFIHRGTPDDAPRSCCLWWLPQDSCHGWGLLMHCLAQPLPVQTRAPGAPFTKLGAKGLQAAGMPCGREALTAPCSSVAPLPLHGSC